MGAKMWPFFFYLYLQVAFSGASSVKLETLGANRMCFHPVLASYSLKGSLLSGKVDDFSIFVISYIKESPKWRSAIKSNYSENKKKNKSRTHDLPEYRLDANHAF